jgi:hypothetical protein
MDDAEVIERKRTDTRSEGTAVPQLVGDAPTKASAEEVRLEWCATFVHSTHSAEALEAPHPDSGVHGHLWRLELSACLLDPQEYEQRIAEERKASAEEQS